jgi:protein-disulfide isomerase
VAANQQGKFWEFHDKLFAGQPKIQRDFLLQYARDLGLDMKRFEQDIYSPRSKAAIDADMAEAKALGVTGTPAFFINGRYLSGAKPFEDFAQSINAELTRLKLPVPAAAPKTGGQKGS